MRTYMMWSFAGGNTLLFRLSVTFTHCSNRRNATHSPGLSRLSRTSLVAGWEKIAYISDIRRLSSECKGIFQPNSITVLGTNNDALDYGLDAIWTPTVIILLLTILYMACRWKYRRGDTKHLLRFYKQKINLMCWLGQAYVYDERRR